MSAYIVSHDHIDALLTFATSEPNNPVTFVMPITGNRVEITRESLTETGRVLLKENERSVRHRYPGDTDAKFHGRIGDNEADYKFKEWGKPLTALSILNGCNCFDYQACETDDYHESLACRIIDAIRHRAILRLPGIKDAPGWEFSR
jgi:hypothetical protein